MKKYYIAALLLLMLKYGAKAQEAWRITSEDSVRYRTALSLPSEKKSEIIYKNSTPEIREEFAKGVYYIKTKFEKLEKQAQENYNTCKTMANDTNLSANQRRSAIMEAIENHKIGTDVAESKTLHMNNVTNYFLIKTLKAQEK